MTLRFVKRDKHFLEGERAYDVYAGDRLVGRVELHLYESWEKSGRIRTRLRIRSTFPMGINLWAP
jgi:hypothetical protein